MRRRTDSAKRTRCPEGFTAVGSIERRLHAPMVAVVEARSAHGLDSAEYDSRLASATTVALQVVRADRLRLHDAKSPKEKWAATLSMVQHGLCAAFLVAERATSSWLRGGPKAPVDDARARIARMMTWLQTNGIVVGAHVAARSGREIVGDDRLAALQAAVRLVPPHPRRLQLPSSKLPANDPEVLGIMAAATSSIDGLRPSSKNLRRVLSTAFESNLEEAEYLRPRSKIGRRLRHAATIEPQSDENAATDRSRPIANVSVSDVVQIVADAECQRLIDELRTECQRRSPATVAALDYLLGLDSRAALARQARVTEKKVICAQRFVDARLAQLRSRFGDFFELSARARAS